MIMAFFKIMLTLAKHAEFILLNVRFTLNLVRTHQYLCNKQTTGVYAPAVCIHYYGHHLG